MHTIFWLENLKERGHSEDLGVDGRLILESIIGKWGEKVWTRYVAQDKDKWRAVVEAVTFGRVP
jgi:hypothetical protein